MKEEEIRSNDFEEKYKELFNDDIKDFFQDQKNFIAVNCPACGCGNFMKEFDKGGFQFTRCGECGTLFVNPRPNENQLSLFYSKGKSGAYLNSRIFPVYEEARKEKIFLPRVELVSEILKRHNINKVDLMIEVGAGRGLFLEVAREKSLAKNYIAIEPSRSCAERLRNGGFRVIEGMFENIRIKEKADLIVNFELIEHLFDPREFIRSCYNLLKAGGLFIVSTPNEAGFDLRVLGKLSDNILAPNHLNYFNPDSIEKLFVSVGFEKLEVITPGKLDVDIIKNKILDKVMDVEDFPFFGGLILNDKDNFNKQLQNFLQIHNLSSNMFLAFKKPN